MTSIELVSPFPRTECVRRLRKRVGASRVAGHVGDSEFRLHKELLWYRNAFQTYLKGSMVIERVGTRIHCRFGLHPLVIGIMTFWFVGIALIGLGLLYKNGDMSFVFFGLLAGAGILLLGRVFARNEEEFLTEFIQKVLEARFS
jgi:hypothetical protein